MRVFYDCEFLEDGRTIDLISIGMVAEDGRELYAVAEEIQRDPLRSRICEHQWLMENVIPHLPQDKREWNRLGARGARRLGMAPPPAPRLWEVPVRVERVRQTTLRTSC